MISTPESEGRLRQLMDDAVVGRPIFDKEGGLVNNDEVIDNLTNPGVLLEKINQKECMLCPAVIRSQDGIFKHFERSHHEVWAALVEWIEEGEPDMPLRPNASNRSVYAQMRLWGWTEEKKANLEVVMRHPSGSTLKVQAPESHARNGPAVLIAVYQMTGVSADEFWEKPNEDEAHFLPAVEPVDRSISTPLLDLLIGQGRPLTVPWMAESMGFTTEQVTRAMAYMRQRHLVKRVKRGMWQAVDHREVTETQTVDMQVKVDQPATQPPEAPVSPSDPIPPIQDAPIPSVPLENTVGAVEVLPAPAPIPMHREVTDDDIYEMLDLLVPDGFKAKHFPAVRDWVDTTVALINALREK